MNKRITRVSPASHEPAAAVAWPGNVRELENAVERAMVVAQEPELREQDFAFKQQRSPTADSWRMADPRRYREGAHPARARTSAAGNQTRAAEVLDIDRVTLHHKLKKYGWSKPLSKSDEGARTASDREL